MTQAVVTAAFGRYCQLAWPDGRVLIAHLKGKKSNAVCGDYVLAHESATAPGEAVIDSIALRRNSLLRQDESRTKVFAANLDAVLFMVAAKPMFSDALLGRALIACHVADIPVAIGLNKTDLPETNAARERLALYRDLGYPVIELSAKQSGGLQALEPLLKGHTTLVLGGSGVGKSTLINALVPNANVATQAISEALNSGKHTTTATMAYSLAWGGVLMDSPGFQSFGLQHISASELSDAFAEFRALHGQCKFYNCTHVHEPGCAVLAAMSQGRIAEHRHTLYKQVLGELQTPAW
jgi:ribosome biogenesis GTPase / thiamine phosphate phosphatase